MMISVTMCTYNGEKYLREQLESIRLQTLAPDEVLIFDDCSTDATADIIKSYIKEHGLNWQFEVNAENKGWRLNFYDAILKATGDIIFFCDQDDVWNLEKIAVMAKEFENNPNILCLSGGQFLIDARGNRIENNRFIKQCKNNYNYKVSRIGLKDNLLALKWANRVGCAMAIKNDLLPVLKTFPRNNFFAHDAWAINTAATFNRCYGINFPALYYRLHGHNASVEGSIISGVITKPSAQKVYDDLSHFASYYECLAQSLKNKKRVFSRLSFFLLKKAELRLKKGVFRAVAMLRFIDVYIRFSTFRALIGDLISPFRR